MRRRYEDTSSLVSYQLKTNQQGDIEVYVDDRFVGNVSEGVCNWRDIEYKSKVTISLKGVENRLKLQIKELVLIVILIAYLEEMNLIMKVQIVILKRVRLLPL